MGSLDLLLSKPMPPILPRRADSLSCILEELSAAIVAATDDHPMSGKNPAYAHLASAHLAEFPGSRQAPSRRLVFHTREAFIDNRAIFAARHPCLRIQVVDAISNVNEALRQTTVWLTCRLSHYEAADMGNRESVAILRWRRCNKGIGWVCVTSTFMHGFFV